MPESTGRNLDRRSLIGIYVHYPFCDVKCAYCDFYSISRRHTNNDFDQFYALSILNDLEKKGLQVAPEARIASIFFGGGTPSKASPYFFESVISGIREKFESRTYRSLEITAEGNPESLTPEKIRDLKTAGINRLSIGIQSFEPSVLKYLGRLYSQKAYDRVIDSAVQAGFHSVSADLIFGVPGQSWRNIEKDIRRLAESGVSHISAYSLTQEPGTLLNRQIETGKKNRLSMARQAFQQERVANLLQDLGFEQYEVSNFARPKKRCLHNLAIWQGREYIGLGVAAHSYLGKRRLLNTRSLEKYLEGDFIEAVEPALSQDYLIGISRLAKWQSISSVAKRSADTIRFHKKLEKLVSRNFIQISGKQFRLTKEGLLFADDVLFFLAD